MNQALLSVFLLSSILKEATAGTIFPTDQFHHFDLNERVGFTHVGPFMRNNRIEFDIVFDINTVITHGAAFKFCFCWQGEMVIDSAMKVGTLCSHTARLCWADDQIYTILVDSPYVIRAPPGPSANGLARLKVIFNLQTNVVIFHSDYLELTGSNHKLRFDKFEWSKLQNEPGNFITCGFFSSHEELVQLEFRTPNLRLFGGPLRKKGPPSFIEETTTQKSALDEEGYESTTEETHDVNTGGSNKKTVTIVSILLILISIILLTMCILGCLQFYYGYYICGFCGKKSEPIIDEESLSRPVDSNKERKSDDPQSKDHTSQQAPESDNRIAINGAGGTLQQSTAPESTTVAPDQDDRLPTASTPTRAPPLSQPLQLSLPPTGTKLKKKKAVVSGDTKETNETSTEGESTGTTATGTTTVDTTVPTKLQPKKRPPNLLVVFTKDENELPLEDGHRKNKVNLNLKTQPSIQDATRDATSGVPGTLIQTAMSAGIPEQTAVLNRTNVATGVRGQTVVASGVSKNTPKTSTPGKTALNAAVHGKTAFVTGVPSQTTVGTNVAGVDIVTGQAKLNGVTTGGRMINTMTAKGKKELMMDVNNGHPATGLLKTGRPQTDGLVTDANHMVTKMRGANSIQKKTTEVMTNRRGTKGLNELPIRTPRTPEKNLKTTQANSKTKTRAAETQAATQRDTAVGGHTSNTRTGGTATTQDHAGTVTTGITTQTRRRDVGTTQPDSIRGNTADAKQIGTGTADRTQVSREKMKGGTGTIQRTTGTQKTQDGIGLTQTQTDETKIKVEKTQKPSIDRGINQTQKRNGGVSAFSRIQVAGTNPTQAPSNETKGDTRPTQMPTADTEHTQGATYIPATKARTSTTQVGIRATADTQVTARGNTQTTQGATTRGGMTASTLPGTKLTQAPSNGD